MTSPSVVWEDPIRSYVLSGLTEGFQFARVVAGTVPGKNWEVPIPVGVNTVQVVYSGASSVTTQLGQPGADTLRPSRLQIPEGSETRMVVAEVPVSKPGSHLSFTINKVSADEVRQPLLGVKIIPVPPATA